jgi:hypothetical protein
MQKLRKEEEAKHPDASSNKQKTVTSSNSQI